MVNRLQEGVWVVRIAFDPPLDQFFLEAIIYVEQIVGVLPGILDHLFRERPLSPIG